MSSTIMPATCVEAAVQQQPPTPTSDAWPQLLNGTALLGRFAGSGLREPPYLVRRRDGQIVQLSQLLYTIASCMDGRELAEIAAAATERLDLRVRPELIAHVAEHKLAPLGLVAYRDGTEPRLERLNPLLALRFRAGIIPARTVNGIAGLLRGLFLPPVMVATLGALLACDVWLATSHGISAGLRTIIHSPTLGLALFGLLILSMAFHECGHAAASRYGGARPGRIGVGIYLVFPAFYTDVTESYRLGRGGRLRTDLGGVYFNALFALTAAGAYFATGYEPLLVVTVTQQALLVDQFVPWLRLDGYHIISDLIGVSDLFARIKPVVLSLVPGRSPDRRVSELKPWARAAVSVWVLTTVAVLSGAVVMIVISAPGYLRQAWQSLILQLHGIGFGAQIGNVTDVAAGVIGAFMLVLPVAGMTLTYLLLCRQMGASLASRGARVDLTLASRGNAQTSSEAAPDRDGAQAGRSPDQPHFA
jgi:putative peptide zinc metalloprotease protein